MNGMMMMTIISPEHNSAKWPTSRWGCDSVMVYSCDWRVSHMYVSMNSSHSFNADFLTLSLRTLILMKSGPWWLTTRKRNRDCPSPEGSSRVARRKISPGNTQWIRCTLRHNCAPHFLHTKASLGWIELSIWRARHGKHSPLTHSSHESNAEITHG